LIDNLAFQEFVPVLPSCPPTPPALPLLLPSYSFCPPMPSQIGKAQNSKRNRWSGRVGGQEKWEGRGRGKLKY